MKVVAQKVVAVATILSLVAVSYFIISVSEYEYASSSSSLIHRNLHVSFARIRRNGEIKRLNALQRLEATEDIWLRRSPEQHRALKEKHEYRKQAIANAQQFQDTERLSICDRETKIGTPQDFALLQLFNNQDRDSTCPGTTSNKLFLINNELDEYGKTGNNIVGFLNALQLAQDNDAMLGLTIDSWVFNVIPEMWMSVQDDDWQARFEEAFCVKVFHRVDEVKAQGYNLVSVLYPNNQLLSYKSTLSLEDYTGHQARYLQTLFRHYNNGKGKMMNGSPVQDMCSTIRYIFGKHHKDTIYSVIHQRSLEGSDGIRLMERMSRISGCDPTGASNMEPDYIKSILGPLGMLQHPAVLISDGEDPLVVERLRADPDIKLHVVSPHARRIGGDITLAVMSNVFIGNPASTLSGIITKARLALGFGHSYMYRAKDESGQWHTVCGDTCVYENSWATHDDNDDRSFPSLAPPVPKANRYLYFFSHNGFSNQLVGLAHAIQLARETNRILIMPPILGHFDRKRTEGVNGRCLMPEVYQYAKIDAMKCTKNAHDEHVSFKEVLDLSELSKSTGVQLIDLCDFVASKPKLAAEYFFRQRQRQAYPEIIDLDGECTLDQTRSYPEMVEYFNSIFDDYDVAQIPSVFASKIRNSQSKAFHEKVMTFELSSKLMALQKILLNYIGQPYVSAHVRYDDRYHGSCSNEPKRLLLEWVQQEEEEEQESLSMTMPGTVYFASSSPRAVVCYKQYFEGAGLQVFTLEDLLVKEDAAQLLSTIRVPNQIMYPILDQLLVSLGNRVILKSRMPQFSTFHMIIRMRHSLMFPDEPLPRQDSFRPPLLGKDFYFGF